MTDFLILAFDILAVSSMGTVGAWGMKYFALVIRKDDLKNLRYIWVPNVISGGFFFVLILGILIQDVFGSHMDMPAYYAVHPFLLVASGFFSLSTYRFVKTVKSHLEAKKQAEVSLEQMQSELVKRLQTDL